MDWTVSLIEMIFAKDMISVFQWLSFIPCKTTVKSSTVVVNSFIHNIAHFTLKDFVCVTSSFIACIHLVYPDVFF